MHNQKLTTNHNDIIITRTPPAKVQPAEHLHLLLGIKACKSEVVDNHFTTLLDYLEKGCVIVLLLSIFLLSLFSNSTASSSVMFLNVFLIFWIYIFFHPHENISTQFPCISPQSRRNWTKASVIKYFFIVTDNFYSIIYILILNRMRNSK